LKEGNENSKNFHGIMSSRKRANTIVSISINVNIVEGVDGIRNMIFNHFASHFQSIVAEIHSIKNLNFQTLNVG